jgi:hypothetical protein
MPKSIRDRLDKIEEDKAALANIKISDIKLDQKLSAFNTSAPYFPGMPIMKFSDTPIDWNYITRDITSHFN